MSVAPVRQGCAGEADSDSKQFQLQCRQKESPTAVKTPRNRPLSHFFPPSSSPAVKLMKFWPLHLSRASLENSWLIFIYKHHPSDFPPYSKFQLFKCPHLVPGVSLNSHFPSAHCSASSQLLRALLGVLLLRNCHWCGNDGADANSWLRV